MLLPLQRSKIRLVTRIGVKYCGNCNPCLDGPGLVKALAQATDTFEFVRWDDSGSYDVLLILNSCAVGCATHPLFEGPCIVATSESIERWPVQEHEYADALLKTLEKYAQSK